MKYPAVIAAAVAAALVLAPVASASASVDAVPGAKSYANCTQLHKKYPHGVGKPGAKDRTSGRPVTTFKRSAALYAANRKSDRDKDGIACEA